jgi:hypothetical protein
MSSLDVFTPVRPSVFLPCNMLPVDSTLAAAPGERIIEARTFAPVFTTHTIMYGRAGSRSCSEGPVLSRDALKGAISAALGSPTRAHAGPDTGMGPGSSIGADGRSSVYSHQPVCVFGVPPVRQPAPLSSPSAHSDVRGHRLLLPNSTVHGHAGAHADARSQLVRARAAGPEQRPPWLPLVKAPGRPQ